MLTLIPRGIASAEAPSRRTRPETFASGTSTNRRLFRSVLRSRGTRDANGTGGALVRVATAGVIHGDVSFFRYGSIGLDSSCHHSRRCIFAMPSSSGSGPNRHDLTATRVFRYDGDVILSGRQPIEAILATIVGLCHLKD